MSPTMQNQIRRDWPLLRWWDVYIHFYAKRSARSPRLLLSVLATEFAVKCLKSVFVAAIHLVLEMTVVICPKLLHAPMRIVNVHIVRGADYSGPYCPVCDKIGRAH